MKEYLRTDGDSLDVVYTAPTGTDSVVFTVYDLDFDDYLQSDEAVAGEGSLFTITLDRDVCKYDRKLRIEIQAIDQNTYTEDEMFISLVRPYASVTEIAEYIGLTIVNANPSTGEATSAELEKLERRARLLIDSKIVDSFKFNYKTIATLGQDTDVLFLGQRIETFDQIIHDDVVIYDTTADPSLNDTGFELTVTRGKNSIRIVNPLININEWVDVAAIPNPGFFQKDSAYSVRGEYGWKYIPSDINQALLELADTMFCSDFQYRLKGIKSIKNDAYTVDFDPSTGTGNMIVDSLIQPYRRWDLWAI
jgi:hypothetical protein